MEGVFLSAKREVGVNSEGAESESGTRNLGGIY